MIPALWGAGIGAGLGLLKHGEQKKADNAQRELAAETARFAPWTGMRERVPGRTSLMGPLMQGALTGAAIGQSIPDLGFGSETEMPLEKVLPTPENAALMEHGGPTLMADAAIDPNMAANNFAPGLLGSSFDPYAGVNPPSPGFPSHAYVNPYMFNNRVSY